MNKFHREQLTGHTTIIYEILEKISAMICDASRSSKYIALYDLSVCRIERGMACPYIV